MVNSSVRNAAPRAVDMRLTSLSSDAATNVLEDAVRQLGGARGRLRIVFPPNGTDAPHFVNGRLFDSKASKRETTEAVRDLFARATANLSSARQKAVSDALERYLVRHGSGPTRSLVHVVLALKEARFQQAEQTTQAEAPMRKKPAPPQPPPPIANALWSSKNPAFEAAVALSLKGAPGLPDPVPPRILRAASSFVENALRPTIKSWAIGGAALDPKMTRLTQALQKEMALAAKQVYGLLSRVDHQVQRFPSDSRLVDLREQVCVWMILELPDTELERRVISVLGERRETTLERAICLADADAMTGALMALDTLPGASDIQAKQRHLANFQRAAMNLARAPFDDSMKAEWLRQSAVFLRCSPGLALSVRMRAGFWMAQTQAERRLGSGLRSDQHQAVFEGSIALQLARELVDPNGRLAVSKIPAIRSLLTQNLRPGNSMLERLLGTLDRLEDPSSGLATAVESIGSPRAANPQTKVQGNVVGKEMVRVTLGLRSDEPITEVHARMAALSALLAPLRQGFVGSCFATSQAIRLHDHRPAEMLADLKSLIEEGHLAFNVPDGAGQVKAVQVPLNRLAGIRELEHPMPRSVGAAAKLAEDPGIALALQAMNLGPNDRLNAVAEALNALDTRLEAGTHITPKLLLEEVAAQRHGITPAHREAASQLPKLVREVQRANAAGDGTVEALEKYQQTSSVLGKKLADFAAFEADVALAISSFQSANENRLLRAWEYTLSAAIEGGESEGLIKKLQTTVRAALIPLVRAVQMPVGSGIAQKLTDQDWRGARGLLLERLVERLADRLSFQYDASILTTLAQDGSSSAGGFALYDRSGATDPQQWRRIESESDLRLMLSGLMSEVASELTADPQTATAQRDALPHLERSMSDALWKDPLTLLVKDGGVWRLSRGYSPSRLLAARTGQRDRDLDPVALQNTSVEVGPHEARRVIRPSTPTEIGVFLIDQLRKMRDRWPDSAVPASPEASGVPGEPPGPGTMTEAIARDPQNFSILASSSNHAFLVKPGISVRNAGGGTLLDALQSQASPEDWWDQHVVAPGTAIGQAPLDDKQVAETVDALRNVLDDLPETAELRLPGTDDPDYPNWRNTLVQRARQLAQDGSAGQTVSVSILRAAFRQHLEAALAESDVRRQVRPALNKAERNALDDEMQRRKMAQLEQFMPHIDIEAARLHPPPYLVVADSNWGTGSNTKELAFLRNPANGLDELWVVSASPGAQLVQRLDEEGWFKGWKIYNKPELYQ